MPKKHKTAKHHPPQGSSQKRATTSSITRTRAPTLPPWTPPWTCSIWMYDKIRRHRVIIARLEVLVEQLESRPHDWPAIQPAAVAAHLRSRMRTL
jgi:hypothetical protein